MAHPPSALKSNSTTVPLVDTYKSLLFRSFFNGLLSNTGLYASYDCSQINSVFISKIFRRIMGDNYKPESVCLVRKFYIIVQRQ